MVKTELTSSIVKDSELECPAVDIPRPVRDGTIDERRPDEDEDHHGN
jgi:hypothetical protein